MRTLNILILGFCLINLTSMSKSLANSNADNLNTTKDTKIDLDIINNTIIAPKIIDTTSDHLGSINLINSSEDTKPRSTGGQFGPFTDNEKQMAKKFPEIFPPKANYENVIVVNNIIYISGQLPIERGELRITGKLGDDISVEQGKEAARLCMLNILSQLEQKFGSVGRIKRCIKITGFINSTPTFTAQAQVINAASELLKTIMGPAKGEHVRTVVGVQALPLGAAVQIDAIFELGQ